MRYFTVEEAQALLPKITEIFDAALTVHRKAEEKARKIHEREETGEGQAHELAIERSQLQFMVNIMNDCLQQIADLGGLPKGLVPALVDFPAKLEGKEIYLCWKLGEKTITHYHAIEEGFNGRKPLPRATHST